MPLRKTAFPTVFVLSALTLLASLVPRTAAAQDSGTSFRDVSEKIHSFTRSAATDVSEGFGGAAWLDYNNDGLLDLFVTNGAGHPNKLFRNNGDGTFTDVARQAGVANGLGNQGVVAADIDNDGCVDLFLTGEGAWAGEKGNKPAETPAKLYINNCNGTFTDITRAAGIPFPLHGGMAAFGDINRDGFLDLFVASPGNIALAIPTRNRLFLNNGNRTFTEISASAGINTNLGACAVQFSDFDNDGWPDIFVANCNGFDAPFSVITTPFELFRNNHNLTFTDVAPKAGLAPVPGDPSLGMGFWMAVTIGDYNRDGKLDIFATNVGGTDPTVQHGLFRNNGDGTFTDVGPFAFPNDVLQEFGWGASFADFDNDGFEDLFFAGSLPIFGILGPGVASPGRFLLNGGNNSFSKAADFGLASAYTTGVAVGDFNNDGFPDVFVTVTDLGIPGQHSLLLMNGGNGNNWLTVKAVGTRSNRSAVGARARLMSGDMTQVKEVYAGTGFLSTNSPWLTFGLGKRRQANIEISWPSGLRELFPDISANQSVTLVEGKGVHLP